MSATNAEGVVTAGNCVQKEHFSLDEDGAQSLSIAKEFSLEEVDVKEQERIHARLNSKLDVAFERAVEEAIRRSLLEAAEPVSATAEAASEAAEPVSATAEAASEAAEPVSAIAEAASETSESVTEAVESVSETAESVPEPTMDEDGLAPRDMGCSTDFIQDLDSMHLEDVSPSSENPRMRSSSPDLSMHNGYSTDRQKCAADSDHADDEDEAVPRSRKSKFQRNRGINGCQSERRPSLERVYQYQQDPSVPDRQERSPSLEQMGICGAERRPSLERVYQHRTSEQHERRPSLERLGAHASERRPSLERMYQNRRRSLERMENHRSERRPSLERLEQCNLERRPSLERKRREERIQAMQNSQDSDGPGQGINTLRPWPLNYHGVPSNWDMERMPALDSYSHFCLVQLSPADREYNAITVDFEEAGLRVLSVERLQNHVLLDRFKTEKDHLLRLRPPDFELNERYLYHGTQADRQRLCEEGLDARLSFQGCFGRGIYFSDNPRKCMQYANVCRTQGDEHAMIVVCRVLLGDPKVYSPGAKDPGLKREPEKPAAHGGWRFYDSVQGVPVDYPEFVVYENRRAMIEYIISFEEKSYRAPPPMRIYNQTPSLYKVDPDPIELPIPEKELDKMYMLEPDTDSDGSCDEHTREVERLRDNVRRSKAKRLGIPYRPPTKEEKRYERLHWKRVCYFSCPPNSPLYEMMIHKKKEEKAARKLRKQKAKEDKAKAENGAVEGASGEKEEGVEARPDSDTEVGAVGPAVEPVKSEDPAEEEVENESVAEVLSNLIADFLTITATDNVKVARRYIMESGMDLDKALCQFFNDT